MKVHNVAQVNVEVSCMYRLKFCINNQNTDESSLRMFYPLLIPWILWSGDLRLTGYLYESVSRKMKQKKKEKPPGEGEILSKNPPKIIRTGISWNTWLPGYCCSSVVGHITGVSQTQVRCESWPMPKQSGFFIIYSIPAYPRPKYAVKAGQCQNKVDFSLFILKEANIYRRLILGGL